MLTSTHYRPLIARILLILFLGMLVNGFLFLHAHRLADGTIITHAHPFNAVTKGPIQPNNHTQQELLWLDAVSNALYTSITPLVLVVILAIISLVIKPQILVSSIAWPAAHTAFQHRGPPFFLLVFHN